ELVTTLPENNFSIYKARFSEAATQKLKRSIVANIIMLGFLTSLTEITSAEAIAEAIRTGVPKGTEELNLKALDIGREMADKLMQIV
ncbi:TPA: 2-oxoacid:ferredoxin oxidoreductase subunit gamma, partial [Candidatus Poribacteria bacterium]|nr:2-oxoacid:ferredoxin oxidoreductase subunit gamma [Candidatus Poribacteria bacterium]